MFPNLRAEIARRNLTYKDVSDLTGIPLSTISRKMVGNAEFTIGECKKICHIFLPEQFSVDYLFKAEGE